MMGPRGERTLLGGLLLLLSVGVLVSASVAGAAGMETGGIAGTVTSSFDGRALPDVYVCAYGPGVDIEEEICEWTSADGSYELVGLGPGQFAVAFWVEGFGGRFYKAAWPYSAATPVTVAAGAVTRGIDEALEVQAPPEENASISGTVTVAATGAPLAGATVCAVRRGGGGLRCVGTDGAGHYSMTELAAGEWNVLFTAEGLHLGLLPQSWDGRSESEDPDPVVLREGTHAEGIDAALFSGGRITGTVRAAATGTPLEKILVCLVPVAEGTPECVQTRTSGEYSFEDVPSGAFKVAFSPEGEEIWGSLIREAEEETGEQLFPSDSWPTQWWNGEATFAAATPISVTAPQTVPGIDGLLGATPTGGGLSGSVRPAPSASPPHDAPPPTFIPTVPTRKRCKPGFVRKQLKRQVVCVKRHQAKRHHGKHHAKPRAHAAQSR